MLLPLSRQGRTVSTANAVAAGSNPGNLFADYEYIGCEATNRPQLLSDLVLRGNRVNELVYESGIEYATRAAHARKNLVIARCDWQESTMQEHALCFFETVESKVGDPL
jgi:hypothetical protein